MAQGWDQDDDKVGVCAWTKGIVYVVLYSIY